MRRNREFVLQKEFILCFAGLRKSSAFHRFLPGRADVRGDLLSAACAVRIQFLLQAGSFVMNRTQRLAFFLTGILFLVIGLILLIAGLYFDVLQLKAIGGVFLVSGIFWKLIAFFAGRPGAGEKPKSGADGP
jgi:hypothetical protein